MNTVVSHTVVSHTVVSRLLWNNRGFLAANHSSASANQNVTSNMLREKPEDRSPSFLYKMLHNSWLNKRLVVSEQNIKHS